MVGAFANDTIERIRPGTKYSRGTPIPDWDNATTATITGCSVQPGATQLDIDGRVLGITDGMTAYLPETADVQAGDKIRYQGKDYAIEGDPRRWTSPTGSRSSIQLALKRWTG